MRPSLYITYMQGRVYVGSINFRDELHNGCHPTQMLTGYTTFRGLFTIHSTEPQTCYIKVISDAILEQGEVRSVTMHTRCTLGTLYELTGPS